MNRLISVAIVSLILSLLTGCVTYGPKANSEVPHRTTSETMVVAAIGGIRGMNKHQNEYALQKEARGRLLNEHNSLTVWQVSF